MSVIAVPYFDPEVIVGENENVSEPNQSTVDTNAGENAVQGTVAEADTSEVDDNIKSVAEERGFDAEANQQQNMDPSAQDQPQQQQAQAEAPAPSKSSSKG